ncbi:hypothetical protein AB0M11_08210 [Streptomyces sp. NPDC051987]|uniref:hypothetical protein n=1 Tax=Streptomyces sp. NPDC051987 TaxID=3155808 RepID=UPI003432532A
MTCGLCGRPATGYLCEWDTRTLAARLTRLPGLVDELGEHLVPRCTGLVEHTAHAAPGPRAPIDLDVVDLLGRGEVVTTMEAWRTDVQRVRWPHHAPPPADGLMAACRWLAMELDWVVANYEQAPDLARDVRQFEGTILTVVGDPPPRPKVVGKCVALTDDAGTVCGADITHLAGQTRLTCRACHTVYATQQDLLLLLHYQPVSV